jgi:D-arginine dehydrogenase
VSDVRVAVVGGGIGGASAAWHLAREGADVVLLDAESHAGTHSTGRSAAVLTTTTGSPTVRRLTRESRPFFVDPPDGFSEAPLASPRAVLRVASSALWEGTERLDADEARRLVPPLRPAWAEQAVLERDGLDLDVDAILQGFLRGLRKTGGEVRTGARVTAVDRTTTGWRLTTTAAAVEADVVVDAAGAWADDVARLAGIPTRGLRPLRRTAFLFAPPPDHDTTRWPLVMDGAERWYVKPDAGLLLGSPADETPTDPCDARPEEIDVALGIDRITEALDLGIRSIKRAWAGLRTFAPDREPVLGADGEEPTFVWLAGQGGYGIKTAPAMGAAAARAALGR